LLFERSEFLLSLIELDSFLLNESMILGACDGLVSVLSLIKNLFLFQFERSEYLLSLFELYGLFLNESIFHGFHFSEVIIGFFKIGSRLHDIISLDETVPVHSFSGFGL